ncbi:NACHT, LRR and PYD domains-containing protein 6 [Manis javanica]|nr:NACHT, LRR and PYD domains-containing protein 6 [Manis javanica]
MEPPEATCSSPPLSTEARAAAARGLLLDTFDQLSEAQLKRFRHKLRDAKQDGRSIPWGRLEGAEVTDLADCLTSFFGPETALDVTRKTLKRADVRDVAAQLKEQRLHRFGPTPSVLLTEYKKKYREHVLRRHAKVKERNARSVKINKRFTKLLIAHEEAALEDQPVGPLEEPPPERAQRSDTHTFNRLFSPSEDGNWPLTVVLQGPAGIGKTMAAKKILYDWAAGKLYHSQVDFAFFMSCSELVEGRDTRSLADLILDQCPSRSAPVRLMLAQPERLLFILDGADELPSEEGHCTDPFQATSGAQVLGSLLSKELLPGARLLVTTRATPRTLRGQESSPQCAEVRGFSDKDKKKYFYKFFQDDWRAERAYRFVKENETLFELCFVPFVCWIVCTVLHRQLKLGQDLSRTSKTTTSVYLSFVAIVLRKKFTDDAARAQGELLRLCLLAREGVLRRKAQFTDKDLDRLELHGSEVQRLFLSKKELPGLQKTDVTYQFMDHSFQEFFTAMSYLLEDRGAPGTPAGGVGELLSGKAEVRRHLTLTTRFLFGLLGTQNDIEVPFSFRASERVKQDALRWVQGQGLPRPAPEGAGKADALEGTEEAEEQEEAGEEEAEEQSDALELLYCLYETQEDALVTQALRTLPELALEGVRFHRMDLAVLSYCVRCCPAGQALRLGRCALAPAQKKKKRSLMKRLQGGLGGSSSRSASRNPQASALRPLCEAMTSQQCGLKSLTLYHCKLSDSMCQDLSEALKKAPALTDLGLLHNTVSEAGLCKLSEGLAWPQCRVQTLRLQQPNLQDALLVGLLRQSPALTTLDLSGCQLPGPTVTCLCVALKHPECRLQNLRLTSVELNEQSLLELRAVRTAKPGLVITHPALDSQP